LYQLVQSSPFPACLRSVSNDEAVVALRLVVLVAHQAVVAIGEGLALDFEDGAQVFKEPHLVAVVLGVVFDVALVLSELLDKHLLLSQLCVEELLVGLELGGEALVGVAQMLGLVTEPLLESLVDVSLNVVLVELALVLSVLAHLVAHVLVEALLLTFDVVAHAVVVALLLVIVLLNFSELVSQRS